MPENQLDSIGFKSRSYMDFGKPPCHQQIFPYIELMKNLLKLHGVILNGKRKEKDFDLVYLVIIPAKVGALKLAPSTSHALCRFASILIQVNRMKFRSADLSAINPAKPETSNKEFNKMT
jgi:hypothetical protein